MKTAMLATSTALLIGCASTPEGVSVDRAQMSDIASTAAALSFNDLAVEGNPMGAAILPIKLLIGSQIDNIENCRDRAQAANISNAVTYAYTANNIAVAAGTFAAAPAIGVAAGLAYWLMSDIDCPVPVDPLQYLYGWAVDNHGLVMSSRWFTPTVAGGQMMVGAYMHNFVMRCEGECRVDLYEI